LLPQKKLVDVDRIRRCHQSEKGNAEVARRQKCAECRIPMDARASSEPERTFADRAKRHSIPPAGGGCFALRLSVLAFAFPQSGIRDFVDR
jgi:hypothetical protein